MNNSYERACTHTCICALVYMHVGDRRRLKRSPTSIALAINALSASASSFCLSPRNARFHIIDVNIPSPLSSFLFSHYSASGCYFFWRRSESVFYAAIPDLSDFHFWIFLTSETLIFDSLQPCLICRSFALYSENIVKLFENVAKALIINYANT